MASPFSRVGKSLIKYFKPVWVTAPHSTEYERQPEEVGSTPEMPQSANADFRLFHIKKTKSEQKADDEQDIPSPPKPGNGPLHWLELVLFLLEMCRRLSKKVTKKVGIETYRRTLMAQGKQKLRAVGTIIDTTPLLREADEPKKRSA